METTAKESVHVAPTRNAIPETDSAPARLVSEAQTALKVRWGTFIFISLKNLARTCRFFSF